MEINKDGRLFSSLLFHATDTFFFPHCISFDMQKTFFWWVKPQVAGFTGIRTCVKRWTLIPHK
jgi:hypothetical protein